MSGSIVPSPIQINLAFHDSLGGHTIVNHVGKSDAWLRQRLANYPTIPAASSFPDVGTAEYAVSQALQANLVALYTWLGSSRMQQNIDHDLSSPIGRVLRRLPGVPAISSSSVTKVRVIVRKLVNASSLPFFVPNLIPHPVRR